ncbi:SDR family oxidoreductase [Pelagibacteraceae bacterium]|jgi:NAD(P)-dependent dehydrogenase (short-subunit alcohol dehydrogenase family)|nr:SDR family oxidoreductase [Pelagibacteraceae bacterium]
MKNKLFIISGGSSSIFQELLKKNYFKNEKIIAIYNSSKNLFKNKNIQYLKINFDKKVDFGKKLNIGNKYKKIIYINFASKKTNKTFLNITNENFINDFKINTLSYFAICKKLLPIMINNNWGRIINVSSTGGEKGDVGTTTYTSTKLASNGITNILSKEFGRFSITSNTIKLGNFNTGMFLNLDQDLKKKLLKEIPVGKTGRISNIYKAIMYLINSEYANNATINIDGGYR